MKYKVNDSCIGCGMCTSVCPTVFHMGDSGLAQAIDGEVKAEDAAAAEEAMGGCPVGAIEQA